MQVFNLAIKESSNAIILVHNHPSGDCNLSKEDEEIIKKLYQAGNLLGIKILDHIIIGKQDFISFKENRMFKEIIEYV